MIPQKIYKLVSSVLSEISIALCFAIFTPIIIRFFALPSSVDKQFPLNIIFQTCDNDLHSVCSFPSATLDYEKNELFSPNVFYYLNVRLKFADVATSNELGFFQNVITFHNETGNTLKSITKSAYVKQPGYLTKACHLFFFPLYLIGFFHDYSTLEVPMTADYFETIDAASTQLVYTLQFANIEDAQLLISARFGFFRHFLYYWPTTSYAVLFVSTFTVVCAILASKWAYFKFSKGKTANQKVVKKKNEVNVKSEVGKAHENKDKLIERKKTPNFAPDEYMPDNYVCGNVIGNMSLSSGRLSTQPCLGFCGRTSYFNESEPQTTQWTKCGACPWGQRANKYSVCEPCEKPLPPYDWMYLLFIALLPLLMHMQFIRNARKYCRTRSYEVVEHLCVIVENLIATVFAVLVFPPRFSVFLYACDKSTYREWYPSMNNPVIDYTKSMRCSYEVVFPLYSLPFVHHLVLIASVLVLRSILYCFLLYKAYNGKPYYYALLSLPLLAAIHALFAGFLYYSFPWILLMGSICSMVYHLAKEGKRRIGEMLARLISSPMHILFLLITMLLLSFSLVAVVTPYDFTSRWTILCLVPLPFILFLLTMPFSHPTLVNLVR